MNRADRRRRAKKGAGPRPGDVTIVTSCVLDGYPCPYCGAITAPDDDGIWACTCGWSGCLLFASR